MKEKTKLPAFLSKAKFHKIDNLKLSKVLHKAKAAQIIDGKVMVGERELSEFLSDELGFESDPNSVKNLVKAAILRAAGKTGNPQDLPDDTTMSDLLSDDAQFVLLTSFLNAIIKHFKPTGSVSLSEVTSCDIVSDVVELVTEKINV